MDIGRLIATLGLDNREFLSGIQEAERQMNTSSEKMKSSFHEVGLQMETTGKKIRGIGQTMSVALTLPLTAAGGVMLRTAADFEQTMNQVAAVSQATGSQLQELENVAREMGATTKFSAVEAAGALNFLAMAGFSVQESITALPATLTLASAGAMDLAQSADIVSNVMQGFGIAATDTEEVVDVLSKAFTSSNTNLQQLGEAMSYAAPMAKAFGQDIISATAAVGFLSDAGIQSTRAGTGLSQSLLQLSKQADSLGIDIKDASGNLIPLADILEVIEDAGISTGVMIEALGARAGPAFATLMERGSGALREFEDELRKSGGTAKEIADTQMQGLNGAITKFQSALSELSISFMQQVLPILTEFAEKLQKLVIWFAELSDSTQKWILIVGAAVAAMGPLLVIVGQSMIAIGGISKAFGSAAGAIRVFTWAKILATRAQLAFNAAYKANPIGMMTMAALALGAALYTLTRRTESQTAAEKALQSAHDRSNEQYSEQAARVEHLQWVVENANISLENRRKALEELQSIVPAYNASLTDEGVLLDNNTESLKMYLEQLREKIRYQAFEEEITKHLQDQERARMHLFETEVRWTELVEKNQRKQLGRSENVEYRRLRNARQESISIIKDTASAMDALTSSQEKYQQQLRETQLNDLLSDLDSMQEKLTSLTRDQLVEFHAMMEKRLPDAFEKVEEAVSELDRTAAQVNLSNLQTGLQYIDSHLKKLAQTAKGTIDAVNALNTISFTSIEQIDIGGDIFGDIEAEFKKVDDLLILLNRRFAALELRSDLLGDVDVLTEKIRITERAITDMIGLVTSGQVDKSFLTILMEQYKELIAMANEANSSVNFTRIMSTLEGEFDRMRTLSADMGGEFARITDAFGETLNEVRVLLGQGLDITDEQVMGLLDRLGELSNQFDNLTFAANQFAEIVKSGIAAMAEDWATGIGKMMAGTETLSGVFDGLLDTLLGVLERLGKLAITTGIAVEGIKKALESLNPYAAIAAGVGLLILVGAVRGSMQNMSEEFGGGATRMAEGGRVPMGFPGDSYPALLTSGETVFPPEDLDKLLAKMTATITAVAENAMRQISKVTAAMPQKNDSNIPVLDVNTIAEISQSALSQIGKIVARTSVVDNKSMNTTHSPNQQAMNNVNQQDTIKVVGKIAGEDIFVSSERFQQRKRLIE